MLFFQYLSWTDSIKPSLIHLLLVLFLKDLLFQNLLQETVKSTLYRSGVVQAFRTIAINLVGQPNVVIFFPKPITADCVKSFETVDKGHVEAHILFLIFLLEMPGCKDLLVFCLSWIHTDFLVEFQPDQDVHAGKSVGSG